MFCRVSRIGEPIESSGATGAAEALASLAWKGLLKRASDRQRSVVRQLVRARIAQEGLDQLEQRRPLGWASPHDPAPSSSANTDRSCMACMYPQHTSAFFVNGIRICFPAPVLARTKVRQSSARSRALPIACAVTGITATTTSQIRTKA